ncbi:MAG TPA: DUF1819 family protein [Firmicutes bacterium]|nr:DUF1819 family protein [Bacillota bacterium]
MDLGEAAEKFGFVTSPVGSHTRRSIAVNELRKLLAACGPRATYAEIRHLALDENILGKVTQSSRVNTFRVLREFYALHLDVPVYSGLRFFWDYDEKEQPLLALLCASARDPVLRESAAVVLPWPQGTALPKKPLEDNLRAVYASHYNESMLAQITRKLLSSWTQAGHLTGRTTKIRGRAHSGPAATAYALFLGYLTGARGNALFTTFWVQVLDAPLQEVHQNAFTASKMGWLDYKNAGGVTEVGFYAPLINTST